MMDISIVLFMSSVAIFLLARQIQVSVFFHTKYIKLAQNYITEKIKIRYNILTINSLFEFAYLIKPLKKYVSLARTIIEILYVSPCM